MKRRSLAAGRLALGPINFPLQGQGAGTEHEDGVLGVVAKLRMQIVSIVSFKNPERAHSHALELGSLETRQLGRDSVLLPPQRDRMRGRRAIAIENERVGRVQLHKGEELVVAVRFDGVLAHRVARR